jgi:hypothetical protein
LTATAQWFTADGRDLAVAGTFIVLAGAAVLAFVAEQVQKRGRDIRRWATSVVIAAVANIVLTITALAAGASPGIGVTLLGNALLLCYASYQLSRVPPLRPRRHRHDHNNHHP